MEDFRTGEGPEANWPWEDGLKSLERNWMGTGRERGISSFGFEDHSLCRVGCGR